MVGVLWLVILLSLIATTLSITSRSEVRLAGNLVDAARAAHAADAGIEWALWSLLLPPEEGWLADGQIHEMELDGIQVRVALYDELGKFNINLTGPEQLVGLFDSIGLDDQKGQELTDAILDWRDKDDLRRLNGAEDDDYLAAGREGGAKDAPFESLAELRQVLGMTEEIYQSIRPALTIYSNQRLINPLVAPRRALLALSEVSEEQIDQYIEDRRRSHEDGLPSPPPPLPDTGFLAPTTRGLNYTVVTEAQASATTSIRQALIIRRRGSVQSGGFEVLEQTRDTEPLFQGENL
ncbi:type II secretion system minor pseudopilin [Marinobacterium arenosum]|uniref:general secretion pathway protein GspK n=1 Tax=Marinobacterium arenosum TaxID=2862496 RepID=UPI001C978E2F|nr:type II secretion system protein GspK [Marinobacterium arenosum]MBY4678554.1 general secretion pathway protein GspK [Marinobacterium arenosum]